MIDAAIATILEEGYYRASSNRIAERAGVTWGVIQHHFGTRERLLLEVARDGADRLMATLESATIIGNTPIARLESLTDVVWQYYTRPEFLVEAQIVLNLGRDPSTAAETLRSLQRISDFTMDRWQVLVDEVVEPARQRAGLGRSLFTIMRGAAVGESLTGAMYPGRDLAGACEQDRALLIRALATQLVG